MDSKFWSNLQSNVLDKCDWSQKVIFNRPDININVNENAIVFNVVDIQLGADFDPSYMTLEAVFISTFRKNTTDMNEGEAFYRVRNFIRHASDIIGYQVECDGVIGRVETSKENQVFHFSEHIEWNNIAYRVILYVNLKEKGW